ncbi:hypothetical protein [Streptomyces sp. WAC04114]|uniref:hypothetical protein n=1 Tax=Streptomyces sp. WAC04114 TaxID=2867961 RepID=UPI001C8C38CD|nr:hypothetical protein [Streptomyces sp. WAC04114]MBX9363870.1 hypothetical protein [Streptomyces sp. WAC04114]
MLEEVSEHRTGVGRPPTRPDEGERYQNQGHQRPRRRHHQGEGRQAYVTAHNENRLDKPLNEYLTGFNEGTDCSIIRVKPNWY